MWRCLEKRGRGLDASFEWAKPTGLAQRAFAYILVYATLRKTKGIRFARSFLVLYHCLFVLLKELRLLAVNPVVPLVDRLCQLGDRSRRALLLGPPAEGEDKAATEGGADDRPPLTPSQATIVQDRRRA